MAHGDGAATGIARLAELVGTAQAGPGMDPSLVLELVAESLGADAAIAGRGDHRLVVEHFADQGSLGLARGDSITLHDQHFGPRITVEGTDRAYAHYESLALAGTAGLYRSLSVPLFTREAHAYGRLCVLFSDAHELSEEGWSLLRLAGRVLMDVLDATEWRYQALHDPLTGLPNRLLLRDRLVQAVASAHRDGHPLAVLLLDLDGFKGINDTFGHHTGDALLCQVGSRLRRPLRESDTVARLGGDEFVVLLPEVDSAGAIQVARKLLRALRRPFDLGGTSGPLWASIGIAIYPDHAGSPAGLLEQADAAMYRAKQREGGYALAATDRTFRPASLHTPHERRS